MHKFILIRKNIKKMYLRIKDGKVIVSAPLKLPLKEIHAFVQAHEDWIHQHLNQTMYISNGDTIKVLDQDFNIVFSDKQEIIGNIIYTPNNSLIFKELLYQYSRQYFYDRFYEIGKILGITDYTLKLRYYKSKWGSCTPSKREIRLNLNLIFTSLECIDAIIYHEYAHTKVLNHSKDFYNLLLKWMPNYKNIIKQLKQVDIPVFEND